MALENTDNITEVVADNSGDVTGEVTKKLQ